MSDNGSFDVEESWTDVSDSDGSEERSLVRTDSDASLIARMKDIQKQGFLYKRGGKDKKQSWRRRWFTFDGKTLKYFQNSKKFISLRVVPVAIMKSAKHIQEPARRMSASAADLLAGGSSKERQYQFELECMNRTFLFGTDSLEGCIEWCNYLQAAVIAHEKITSSQDLGQCERAHGGEMSTPDITGFIKFNNRSKKYFVVLKNDKLKYYWNEEDYSYDSPIHEINMLTTSVKEVDKLTLELNGTPDQNMNLKLRFERVEDAASWFTMISTAIYNVVCPSSEIVDNVRQTVANRTCADCTATEGVVWASINLGIVICLHCAGPHRALGVSRSKVRSLQMDNVFRENRDVLQLLHVMGNENANMFWYKHPPEGRVIDKNTPAIVRLSHIKQKYAKKAFVDSLSEEQKANVDQTLVSAVKRGDIVGVMKALHYGANIYTYCSATSHTVFQIAEDCGYKGIHEYLLQNEYTDFTTLTDDDHRSSNGSDRSDKKASVYFEGFLEKTGPNMKGFLKRRCVLHNGTLSYYDERNAQKSTEKGCLDISEIVCICTAPCQKPNCFDLSHCKNKRLYRFAAANPDLKRQWMFNIARALANEELPVEDGFVIAGYFYTKTENSKWNLSWIYLKDGTISITNLSEPNTETKVTLSSGTQIFQKNSKKHTCTKEGKVLDPMSLNGNQYTEIVPQDMSGITFIQGQMLEDTCRLHQLIESEKQSSKIVYKKA